MQFWYGNRHVWLSQYHYIENWIGGRCARLFGNLDCQ